MAKYRQVHITYWQDPFIEELEPLEKYFYLYLMTNSKTTQCGCYEISMKLIKYETGLTKDQIEAYINLFQAENKIYYDYGNNEFLIINWLKHNSFKSPKVKACILGEAENIKTEKFKTYIDCIVNKNMDIGRPLIDYTKSIDTGSQQEEEQEEEQEQEKKDFKTLMNLYTSNIELMPSKVVMDGLIDWHDTLGFDIVKESIMIAAKANAKRFSYLEAILRNWLNDGVKTIDDIKKKPDKKNVKAKLNIIQSDEVGSAKTW